MKVTSHKLRTLLLSLLLVVAGIVAWGLTMRLFGQATLPERVAHAAVPLGLPQTSPGSEGSQLADPTDPFGIADFNCNDLARYGIEKQANVRAAAILEKCRGKSQKAYTSSASTGLAPLDKVLAPLAFGGTDRNIITGAETSPRVTQSTSHIWANGNKILVAYNDSRGTNQSPSNLAGASVSTDGGATFTRLTLPNGHSPFSNTYGVPVALYHAPSNTWHTVWLSPRCGGQGLARFEAPDASMHDPAAWVFDGCVHSSGADDRQHGWVDNNPASPFYGRMYVSWNDFNGNGAMRLAWSSDGGTTWSAPVVVSTTFIRNVEITGDVGGGGAVYIAGVDEMGGGLGNQANKIYRSTDGGVTWANTYTGPTFSTPGRGVSGWFPVMYTSPNYWRQIGWGQPGALGNVVHYAYASRNTGNGDPGNVFYIRSTDMGVTFSAPVQMNTDAGTRAQWMPSLSVGQGGSVFMGWYDERETASCALGNPSVPCYRRFGRASSDNGLTWGPDDVVGDLVSPLPAQPDPGIATTYAGDGDHAFAQGNCHYQAWTDGRVAIGGQSQQDVAFDAICGIGATPTRTATPAPCVGVGVGPWSPVAPYTITVRNPAVATDGVYLYVMGGTDGFTVRNIVQRYDPATNTWLAMANLPSALEAASATYAAVNNRIYVFGGYNSGGSTISTVYVYNIATNSWSTGAPMPDTRRNASVAYYGGNQKIYVIGGHSQGPEQNQTWEYDPVANTWASRANIPVSMGDSATAIVGQYIYLMGSEGGGGGTTLHYRYDIVGNTWTTRAPLPANTYGAAAGAVVSNTIVLFGGGTNIDPYNTSRIYNIATDSWMAGSNMTTPHFLTGGTAIGNRLFVVGGWTGGGYTNVVETALAAIVTCPTPTSTTTPTITTTPTRTTTPTITITRTATPTCVVGGTPGAWQAAPPVPTTIMRNGFAQVDLGPFQDLYVLGGYDGTGHTNAVRRYRGAWFSVAPMPAMSGEGTAAAYYNGKIYVVGGYGVPTSFQIYDIASNTWTAGPALPMGTYGHAMGAHNGRVYVAGGGFPATTNLQIFDIAGGTWSTGPALPSAYLWGGYRQVGEYLFLIGSYSSSPLGRPENAPLMTNRGRKDLAPLANSTVSQRLDMATDTWTTGPAWTPARADFALAYYNGKLYAIGGDATGGTYFDPTDLVDELNISAWPAGSWIASPPNLPQARMSNSAGFNSTIQAGGEIWSTGGYPHSTVGNEHLYRRGLNGCPTSTATSTITPTRTPSPMAPWGEVAEYPSAVAGNAVATDGAYLYSFGGQGLSGLGPVNLAERYDPANDEWTERSAAPIEIYDARSAYAEINGNIYLFGGKNSEETTLDTTYVYDVERDRWATAANMPAPRSLASVAYFSGTERIYVIGGFDENGVEQQQTWEYDPRTDKWIIERADIPVQMGGGSASAIVEQFIYLMGGSLGGPSTLHYRYDINNDTWEERAPLPAPRIMATAGAVNVMGEKIVLFGGGGAGNYYATSFIYDIATDSWTSGPDMNLAHSNAGGTAVGDLLVVVGGRTDPGWPTDVVETSRFTVTELTPTPMATATATPSCPSGPWTAASPAPANIARYAFARDGLGRFYVISGVSNGTNVNTVYRYDPPTGTWTTLAPIPMASEAPAAAYNETNNSIYVLGGYNAGATNACHRYDVVLGTWSACPAMNRPTWGAAAGAFNNRIYVAGGDFPSTTALSVFDVAAGTWSAGTTMPSAYILGGYQQVGNYLYVVGSYTAAPLGPAPSLRNPAARAAVPAANSTVSQRLDMTTAAGSWTTGPTWTQERADIALAYNNGKLFAIGGDATGGGYFDPTQAVDELDIASWPAGAWSASPPDLPTPARQANSAGFNSGTRIWSTGGIDPTFTWTNQHLYREVPIGGGGLLVANGITIGYGPHNYTALANNHVSYTYANSQSRPNQYAIFQTHDPWGFTVMKNAITSAGRTYTVFPPSALAGFNYSQWRVIVLNWDDHYETEFEAQYSADLPQLEAYVQNGGVLWIQGAIQETVGGGNNLFSLPFGGAATFDLHDTNLVVQTGHPLAASVPNPFTGNSASHTEMLGLPADATVIIVTGATAGASAPSNTAAKGKLPVKGNTDGPDMPSLYEWRPTGGGGCPTATVTSTRTPTSTLTPTAGASVTPTCPARNYRILIAYADTGPPNNLRNAILAEPNVAVVDYFDAQTGTPTLAQLQNYDIVVTFSNQGYADAITLGNNLADYVDGGGIVAVATFGFHPHGSLGVQGRWRFDGYAPYTYSGGQHAGTVGLGAYNPGHPLMQGVTVLTATIRQDSVVAVGATQVAAYTDGNSAVAYKGRAVGFPAYLGDHPYFASGHYGRIIVNAGRWLNPAQCATNTPTRTNTPTNTRTNTATNTATNTRTATATPSPCPGGYVLNFAPAVNYVVGTNPLTVVTGTFDANASLDLAVTNYNGNSVSILLGNGNGTFQPAVNYPVGANPRGAAVGTFDAGGTVDLAVANYFGNNVSILLGNGNGTFQAAVNYPVGFNPGGVAVGDFNANGSLDLAVTNVAGNNLSILLGNGNGTFQAPVNYATGSEPIEVAVGTFDANGTLDLAVTNLTGNSVSILLGNGNGTFQPAVNYPVGTFPLGVTVGDFNANGSLDLVVANTSSGNLSILLGNGNGTFQAAVNFAPGIAARDVAAGNFDANGSLDLVVTGVTGNAARILLGNGDGTFQAPVSFPVGANPYSVTVGPFDGNGSLDVAVTNYNDHTASVLLNTSGCATPTSTVTITPTRTITPTATICIPPTNYTYITSTTTLTPGTSLVPGSTCDDCAVNIVLPFPYSLYGTSYSQASASNKGVLQFVGTAPIVDNQCMPTALLNSSIAAFWDNLNTNINDVMGIYTRTLGTAPNRTFIIQWRGGYIANDITVNFEVILYEGQEKFDLVYGSALGAARGNFATIGVQQGTGPNFTQYSCNTASVQTGRRITFTRICGAGPTR